MKNLTILTTALLVLFSSAIFADHQHNAFCKETQEFVPGYWEKQFVPAQYKTTQVWDGYLGRYVTKQILVSPSQYKKVYVPGKYVTKTICKPAPVYPVSTPTCTCKIKQTSIDSYQKVCTCKEPLPVKTWKTPRWKKQIYGKTVYVPTAQTKIYPNYTTPNTELETCGTIPQNTYYPSAVQYTPKPFKTKTIKVNKRKRIVRTLTTY